MLNKTELMKLALQEAKKAEVADEVPVGAILCDKNGEIIAKSHNLVEKLQDPTAHAEMLVIKKACKALETKVLSDYTLLVTLEPCAMCAQAIAWAKVGEVVFGAYDVKSGGVVNGARVFDQNSCHHKPKVYGGILESESAGLIQAFFQKKR